MTTQLRPDPERPGCWLLLVDGTAQSHVDAVDPTYLSFEYMRRLASIVDAAAPPGEPIRVLHLGGGALTLPRYVAATRPRSGQRVVEADAELVALVRQVLPVPRGIRVRIGDGRTAVEESGPGRYDLVVTDVFAGARVPARFASTEFATAVARVLRGPALYAVNLADGPPLRFTRGQVATLRSVFGEVCLLADPGVLRGRRFGNIVVAASMDRAGLPLDALAKAAARDPFPARLVHGADLERFAAGARPVPDAAATDSPAPPDGLFARPFSRRS